MTFKLLGQLPEHVDLTVGATTLDESVHHVGRPGGALSARCALTTRLVLVELGESSNGGDDPAQACFLRRREIVL